MKEEKLIRKRRNPKGSVLFTVVAVMMVMIVFVMATLTIAGAANKRAYSSYSKNQTTYTARSAVDSVYSVLVSSDPSTATADEKAFAKAINAINTLNEKKEISVTLPSNIGKIGYYNDAGVFQEGKLLVECVDDKYSQPNLDATTNKINDDKRQLLRITATSILGDEESTVSMYLVKNPIINPPSSSGMGAGLITTGGASTGSSSIAVGGGTAINLGESKWHNNNKYNGPTWIGNNNTDFLGMFTAIGSVTVGSNTEYHATQLGDGFSVFGNLNMQKDGLTFNSNVPVDDSTDYNKIPYVYVEGRFDYDVNGGTNLGSSSNPINVYVGGSMKAEAGNFYSDIYIYNHDFSKDANEDNMTASEYANNSFTDAFLKVNDHGSWFDWHWQDPHNHVTYLYANANGSKIIDWITETLTNQDIRQAGGNIYTKGCMQIGGNGTAYVEGDVYVEKDLYIQNTVINGSLTCNGTLVIGNNVTVKGGIYMADSNKLYGYNVKDKDGNQYDFDTSKTKETWLNEFNARTNNLGATTFPANKDLPEILGYGSDANQIVSTQEDLNQSYDPSQYPTTMDSVPTVTYDLSDSATLNALKTTVGDLKNSITNPNADTFLQNVLNDSDTIYYINSSCNLKGSVSNNTIIYIDPATDLWINLDNLYLDNQSAIVVNTMASGTVKFYVDDNKQFDLNNSYLMTSYYYDILKNNKQLDMKKAPDINTDEKYMIPNAYIYSNTGATGARPKINYTNNCCISAYIYAPNLNMNVAIPKSFNSPTYDGVSVYPSVAVIGGAFVHEMNANNKTGSYYIGDGGGASTPSPTPIPDLTVLKAYYQNS